jgi:hypothetical protein
VKRDGDECGPAVPRRWRRRGIVISLLIVVLAAGAASAFAYMQRPGFCATACHEMRPFAASLGHSGHRGMACATCHQDAGLRNTLAAEWTGMGRLARHVNAAKAVELDGIDAAAVPSRRCLACHGWRALQRPARLGTATFDHLSHSRVDCVVCHLRTAHPGTAGVVADPPATMLACFGCHTGREGSENCLFCHAKRHPGRGRCQTCHGLTGWRSGLVFRHAIALGKHRPAVRCEGCHNEGFGRGTSARPCAACHEAAHGGLTDCARCHRLRAWLPTTYRHPAVGGHVGPGWAAMACERCHPGGSFARASCGCHTPPAGHASLTGGHRWLVCGACHAGGRGGAARCSACHAAPHRRPTDCARCHGLAAWRPARFAHPAAGPHLAGALRLACRSCHTSGYGSAACRCHGSTRPGLAAPRSPAVSGLKSE